LLILVAGGVEGAGLRTDIANITKSSSNRQQHVKNFPRQAVDNASGRSLFIPKGWWNGLNIFAYMEAVDETSSLGPEYSIFRNLIVAAGLEEVVQEGSMKSIFAPDDSAISAELENFLMKPENKDLLVETVKYHLVADPFDYLRFNSISLQTTRTLRLPTMQGSMMEIKISTEGMFINGDARIRAFMRTDNWDFLYRIDRVLPPPSLKHLFPEKILEPAYAATDANGAFEFPIILTLLDIFLPVPPQNDDDDDDNNNNNFGEEVFHMSESPSSTPSAWKDSGPPLTSKDISSNDPSSAPTDTPSVDPSQYPSTSPSETPSVGPSQYPSTVPSDTPSLVPSDYPSTAPSRTHSDVPSDYPSISPLDALSVVRSDYPSISPSDVPSVVPSDYPTNTPPQTPSVDSSDVPTDTPTLVVPSQFIDNVQERTLLDLVSEADNLFWFLFLVEVAEMEGPLLGRGPLTVFAPNDEAFRGMDRDYLLLLLSSPDYRLHAVEVIQFHLSRKNYSTADFVLGEDLDTFFPQSFEQITLNADENGLFFATSTEPDVPIRIAEADSAAKNGWLHIIDRIFKPRFMHLNPRSFLAEAQFQGEVQIFPFLTLVVAAGLEEELELAEDISLFVPINNAIPTNIFEFLLDAENEAYLAQVVKYHIVPRVINFENLDSSTPTMFVTEQGSSLTMAQSNALYVDGAVVIDFSLVKRGIIYQIDSILIPPLQPKALEEISGDNLPGQETLEDLDILKLNELLSATGLETDSLVSENDDRLMHLPTALMLFQNQTRSTGALTVFFPNKRALKTMVNEYGVDLKKSAYKLHLITLLAFHATEGKLDWEALLQNGEIEMLTGDTVDVFGSRYGVFLTSSAMYSAQIILSVEVESIGIIHVVTRMLLPSWTAIYDHVSLMESIPWYSSFLSLIVGAGLDGLLRSVSDSAVQDPHYRATVIAPDNNALNSDLVDYLLSPGREDLAKDVVLYHVIPELFTHLAVGEIEEVLTVLTLQGETIDLAIVDGDKVLVESTTRLLAYSLTRRGVLYRSENLMIPPASRDLIPPTLLPQGMNEAPLVLSDLEFPIILTNP